MIQNPRIQQILLFLILALHGLLLVTHLTLHVRDEVNPWKLGGYGMYTMPSPATTVTVIAESNPDRFVYVGGLREHNWYFNWYCKTISKQSLDTLLTENHWLIGEPFTITVTTEDFRHYPAGRVDRVIHEATVTWETPDTYLLSGVACGRKDYSKSDTIVWKP